MLPPAIEDHDSNVRNVTNKDVLKKTMIHEK
jgi:hypothetical protein